MANRNLIKTADKVTNRVANGYGLKAVEAMQLMQLAADQPYYAVQIAFQYGYVMGGRAAKAGKYSECKNSTGILQAAGSMDGIQWEQYEQTR